MSTKQKRRLRNARKSKAEKEQAIFRTITFKPDADKAAEECLEMLDGVDRNRAEGEPLRVMATNTVDGCKTITVRFEDELDYLAFLVAIGAAKAVDHVPGM